MSHSSWQPASRDFWPELSFGWCLEVQLCWEVLRSSLFRVIRKLWPLVEGTITMPDDKELKVCSHVLLHFGDENMLQ